MCGILGILGLRDDMEKMRKIALIQSKKLRHRGPDWSGIFASSSVILAHERLAIVGLNSGGQPLFNTCHPAPPSALTRNSSGSVPVLLETCPKACCTC